MSINNQNTYLNIEDAHLRLRTGNVYAQGITIGGITVDPSHGLQRVSDTGNVTTNTLQFDNATTAFTTTANATIGRDLTVTGNVTVSSNLTVTGNAVVSDDLTVTENLLVSNNLTVTGNTFYTNPAAVLVDSNVVTEYTGPHDRPLRKYPEVAMTADDNSSTSGYIASTSTSPLVNIGEPFHAFDGDNTFTYHTNYPTATYNSDGTYGANSGASKITDVDNVDHDGEWLKIQLPKAIKVEYMKFQARVSYSNRFPNKLSILGSNDNSNWYLLLRDDNVPLIQANPAFHTIQINATTKYKYYVLVLRELSHSGAPSTTGQVSGWELYGHEEGSGSLDTTLKSVYNVPATTGTQLEVYYDGQDYSGVTSTVTDKVGTATNATISNSGSTITFDSTYKAWTFGGDTTRTDTFISAALPSSFVDDQSHSVSLWFNPSYIPPVTSSFGAIFSIALATGEANSQNIQIQLNGSDTFSYVFWNNDEGFDVPMGKSIVKGQWYHLSATYEPSTGTRNIFLNGEKCVSNGVGGANPGADLDIQSGSVIKLGARINGTQEYFGSIANFRLYSKALNAGQIKELYDYQKDYFLGSKSQVTLYKGHLGVGVTEPSGQLVLAGDERIQEYPPRGLTNFDTHIEGHGVFKASASSSANNYRSFDAFDKDADPLTSTAGWVSALQTYDTGGTGLASGGTAKDYFSTYGPGSWLKLELPYAIKLKSSKFSIRAPSNTLEPLKSFTIYGSKDNTSWNVLYSQSTSTPQSFSIDINSTEYYKCFVIHITEVDHNQGYAGIVEWRLFGTPGPTTLDKGSLSLTRSLDVPRISRYDVDTETPRPEKLVVDFDTTVNSSPTDISGKGNHGTMVGATYSPADKAFVFDGTDDVIDNNLPSELVGDPTLTISMWVNPITLSTASSQYDTFIHIGQNSQDDQIQLTYYGFDGHLWIGGYGQSMRTNDASAVPIGQWTHLCAVITPGAWSATTKKLYINGEFFPTTLSGSGTSSIPTGSTTSRLVFGGVVNGSGGYSHHANIKMSNPKLYDVALEPSEVKKLYNLGRTGRSMVISDTAVGIGKVPEAQLDVRGILKASVGLFHDKPFFTCPVARYGLKAFANPTVVKWYSGSGVLSNYTFTTAQRWLLATVPEENVMYATQNVKLVSIFNDSASETSGVQVPYKGKYLLIHHCRTNNTSSGTTFLIYSRKLNEYIITSANNTIIPFGGNSGTSAQYNGVQTVVHLDEGDIVSFIFTRTPNTTGSYEQMASLVML